MARAAASLAAVLALALGACGDGAEPGASREATLVLDFQPNAVHAGIYAALAEGEFARRGIELEVREPAAATDAPKLLAAGRAELAILDINDLGLARERGIDVVGVAAIVQRPLAAVIAADRSDVRRPRDLEGGTVGVTGLPSDEAVLDSVLEADGADPASVERVTIGFDSVAALSGGRLDAATAFWNAEGTTLRRLGVPTREFRIDDYGAPSYPELVLVASAEALAADRGLIEEIVAATGRGYASAIDDPAQAIEALGERVNGIDADEQRAQLATLLDAGALSGKLELERRAVAQWARWATAEGILAERPVLEQAFASSVGANRG